MSKSINTLSLFSGGGLLDLGFMNQGYQIQKAVEIEDHFITAYNHGLSTYLEKTTNNFIGSSKIEINKIDKAIDASSYYQQNKIARETVGVSGIIGGPPCQDFSNGGKHRGIEGDRGKLLYSYINIVAKVNPDFIFFENVPSLFSLKSHQSAFYHLVKKLKDDGYHVWYKILNSLDYGIPQDRSRITLVGFKEKLVKKLIDNNYKLVTENEEDDSLVFKWPKKKFLNPKSIKWPGVWNFRSEVDKREIDLIPLSHYELTVKAAFKGLSDKTANQMECFEPYSKKFYTVNEGDTHSKSFKRLHRYRYSPTVAYGNNEVHLHPTFARRLTVREALRLQSVPDGYELPKDLNLTAKFKVISNGVPTYKAELIAKEIKRTLDIYASLI